MWEYLKLILGLAPFGKIVFLIIFGWTIYLLVIVSFKNRLASPYFLLYSCSCIWCLAAWIVVSTDLQLLDANRYGDAEGMYLVDTLKGDIVHLLITNGTLAMVLLIHFLRHRTQSRRKMFSKRMEEPC